MFNVCTCIVLNDLMIYHASAQQQPSSIFWLQKLSSISHAECNKLQCIEFVFLYTEIKTPRGFSHLVSLIRYVRDEVSIRVRGTISWDLHVAHNGQYASVVVVCVNHWTVFLFYICNCRGNEIHSIWFLMFCNLLPDPFCQFLAFVLCNIFI